MALPLKNEKPGPPSVSRRWLATGSSVTLAAALAALLHSRLAALGVLLGGAAGTVAFGLLARQMGGLRGPNAQVALQRIYVSVVFRLVLYGAALLSALALDPRGLRAFAGAAAGILLVLAAVITVGAVEARRIVKRLGSDANGGPGCP